jgi:pimeloyl-ACP methyl ester carboxylesterase
LILGVSLLNPSFAYALVVKKEQQEKLQNITVNPLLSSSLGSKPSYSSLDPNPSLIDKDGNLTNDISKAASLTTYRNGTIADAISKLLLVIDSNNTLQFSIDGTTADNLTNGVLSSLDKEFSGNKPSSTVNIDPRSANNRSVVVAVYTPPDYINLPENISNRTVNILTNDTNNSPISIQLYRTPVVLVHGLWTNPTETWIESKFKERLDKWGFSVYEADYSAHNAATFDPYAIPEIGNYGIDAVRNKINDTLEYYNNNKSIAASQVDVIAHSMGGLMARGFVQQHDYNTERNFMNGYIHRLITIGTPHFGGQLAEILYNHRDDWHCFDLEKQVITFQIGCQYDLDKFQFMPLKTIYGNEYGSPLDNGAVEALIPGSVAYSHLCQTNVSSYAIAGSWAPYAFRTHEFMEELYESILGSIKFDLDEDGFQDNFQGNNDLAVNLTSQIGGLNSAFRLPGNVTTVPNESVVYPNTVHWNKPILDPNIHAEIDSPVIHKDVISLLSSPDNKFADAIGIGSPCQVPKQTQ